MPQGIPPREELDPSTPPQKCLDWLWQRITQFAEALWDIWLTTLPAIFRIAGTTWKAAYDRHVDAPGTTAFEEGIKKAEKDGLPSEIAEELREVHTTLPYPINGLVAGAMGAWLTVQKFFAWLSAMANLDAQQINVDIKPNLIEQAALLRLLQLDHDKIGEIGDLLDKWGLPNDQQLLAYDAMRRLPELGAILPLRNREHINDTQALKLLTQLGFREDDPEDLLKLREFYPSPSDLVMLAAREAFEPDAIEKFEMLSDFPDNLPSIFAKAGVSKEWTEAYWVAHWTNPSIQQVFEMIHRGVTKPDGSTFTLDDLDTYYKLADVNPFFGDLLRQVAFSPLTRVDIRRFRARDLLTEQETVEAYKALGYDEKNAGIQADFAEDERRRFGRELSRTQLERLRRIGEIREDELHAGLILAGYDGDEADQIVLLLNIELETDKTEAERDRIKYLFIRHQLDDIQANQALSDIGVQGISVGETLEQWRDERVTRRQLPSKADAIKWLSGGIINPKQFAEIMRLHRYDDRDIIRYIEQTMPNPLIPQELRTGGTI